MKRCTFLLCVIFCLIAVGCSGNKKLTGKVTFSDGEPVPKGMVIFEKDNYMSRGEIQPDGSYTMSTERANDGIPPGEYKVYVSGVMDTPKPQVQSAGGGTSGGAGGRIASPSPMPMPIRLCDAKFENPNTSGLTCTIPAPGNRFDFKIERSK
jgi:hypothetical protein